jgi:hypothetical protein
LKKKHFKTNKNMIKVLSNTMTPSQATEFVNVTIDGHDRRMKIVVENGNAYSRLQVYTVNIETGLHLLASNEDIPGYKYIYYYDSDNKRIDENKANIEAAKNWINQVFA